MTRLGTVTAALLLVVGVWAIDSERLDIVMGSSLMALGVALGFPVWRDRPRWILVSLATVIAFAGGVFATGLFWPA
jgi:hypothetical protein